MKYRALFHLEENSAPRVQMTLNNIENLIADMGRENVSVELVVNGNGVQAFTRTDELAQPIAEPAALGVRFAVCGNSLRGNSIPAEDLLEQVKIVPSGVSELVREQSDGWAYIRP